MNALMTSTCAAKLPNLKQITSGQKSAQRSSHHPPTPILLPSMPFPNLLLNTTTLFHSNSTINQTSGRFGPYGGRFVPETLMASLFRLESELNAALDDPTFHMELETLLRDYVGRETPLYLAERLSERYKDKNGRGPEIYLKREDLVHGGAHKLNNALPQAMLAQRMGLRNVVAATGAGQHGVAVANSCARLGLECQVYMAKRDMEKQSSNVILMKLAGAKVIPIDGGFKEATSEAIKGWVNNLDTSYFLSGTAAGPHPLPEMVKRFQKIIGKETRKQAMEKWGGRPDVLVACVGSGSNALGLFHEFVLDDNVRLIGVEAAGSGLNSGKHSATMTMGDVGVYHGSMGYLLQDEEGQIIVPHSIGVGLEYPAVSPELSFLKDTGRAEFHTVTDQEAVEAFKRVCTLEGIFAALETCHALAFLEKLCPTLPHAAKVVVCCSGRGDKDAQTIINQF